MLRTFRDGLVAQAGHDLTIEVTIWNGELTMGDQGIPIALEVRVQHRFTGGARRGTGVSSR